MYYYTLLFLLLVGPVFGQHTFHKVQTVQQVVVPQRVVQFDSAYYLGLDGYYSVGDKIRQEKAQEKSDELTEAQKDREYYKGQVELLLKVLAANNGAKLIPSNQPTPNEPTEVTPQPTSGNYDDKVLEIFNAKCARCHGENKSDAGLSLVKNSKLQYNNDTLADFKMREKIFDLVYGANLKERGLSQMPKGSSLSDEEVEYIRLWMVTKAY
jgi:mono/diheme cytochrome c family protein